MGALSQPFAQAFGRLRDRVRRGDTAGVEAELGGARAQFLQKGGVQKSRSA
ncbi:MAG: hypothetical protein JWO64_2923 [Hyphomicrobiales bacterium]|jgi:hypothetical protein|nr:hypothetical protein [Hyphomicrobiales bacterium]